MTLPEPIDAVLDRPALAAASFAAVDECGPRTAVRERRSVTALDAEDIDAPDAGAHTEEAAR